jgi:fermentation-respiration switch protein FrsA (DUF1100 family)
MLSHGTADDIVPISMGRELYGRARVAKRMLEVYGGGHSDAYITGNQQYFAAWKDFVNLSSDPEASPVDEIIRLNVEDQHEVNAPGSNRLCSVG